MACIVRSLPPWIWRSLGSKRVKLVHGLPLETEGYAFTTLAFADDRPGQFATWTVASDENTTFSNYTDPIALFSNSGRPTTMSASNGSAFNVDSLAVGYLYRSGGSATLTFSGALSGGAPSRRISRSPVMRCSTPSASSVSSACRRSRCRRWAATKPFSSTT